MMIDQAIMWLRSLQMIIDGLLFSSIKQVLGTEMHIDLYFVQLSADFSSFSSSSYYYY